MAFLSGVCDNIFWWVLLENLLRDSREVYKQNWMWWRTLIYIYLYIYIAHVRGLPRVRLAFDASIKM